MRARYGQEANTYGACQLVQSAIATASSKAFVMLSIRIPALLSTSEATGQFVALDTSGKAEGLRMDWMERSTSSRGQ